MLSRRSSACTACILCNLRHWLHSDGEIWGPDSILTFLTNSTSQPTLNHHVQHLTGELRLIKSKHWLADPTCDGALCPKRRPAQHRQSSPADGGLSSKSDMSPTHLCRAPGGALAVNCLLRAPPARVHSWFGAAGAGQRSNQMLLASCLIARRAYLALRCQAGVHRGTPNGEHFVLREAAVAPGKGTPGMCFMSWAGQEGVYSQAAAPGRTGCQ